MEDPNFPDFLAQEAAGLAAETFAQVSAETALPSVKDARRILRPHAGDSLHCQNEPVAALIGTS